MFLQHNNASTATVVIITVVGVCMVLLTVNYEQIEFIDPVCLMFFSSDTRRWCCHRPWPN